MQKSLKIVFLIIAISLNILAQTAIAPSIGDGTENNPYQIASLENLYWMAEDIPRWEYHYIQTADIDAYPTASWFGGAGWPYIGGTVHQFTGSYNGREHVIDHLTSTKGLFCYIKNAEISNLGIINVNISGDGSLGGLTGYSVDSDISNCYATGSVTGTEGTIGGLIGKISGSVVSNCHFVGTVSSSGSPVGGLIGYSYFSTVNNSYTDITVTGGGTSITGKTGGLIGSNSFSDVIQCYAIGSVAGTIGVGGLVGMHFEYNNEIIDKCYSSCSVKSTVNYAGGLVGRNYAKIRNSYSSGAVNGVNNVGGLVGKNDSGVIINCYSLSPVHGTSYVGGLVGYNGNAIENCYSVGSVTGNDQYGGLVGDNSWGDHVKNSFWDIVTSGQLLSEKGTGKTTAEMKMSSTYTNTVTSEGLSTAWDFLGNPHNDVGNDDYWNIDGIHNDGYPWLSWQVYPEPIISTNPVSNITDSTAVGSGNIIFLGNPYPFQHGVCWDTTNTPSVLNNKTEEGNASSIGSFTSFISGLLPNTTYYVRAYATNTETTSYGNVESFTTRYITVNNLTFSNEPDLQHLVNNWPEIHFNFYDSYEMQQEYYQIQLSNGDFSLSDIIWDSGDVSSSSSSILYNGPQLIDGKSYSLRVRAGVDGLWSGWEIIVFRLNTPPTVPVQLSLIDDSVATSSIYLKAESFADADADDLSFIFRLYSDSLLTSIIDSSTSILENSTIVTWQVNSTLTDNARYWWTIEAYDGYEYSQTSAPASFYFNCQNDFPSEFTLLSPIQNEVVTSFSPIFIWESAFDPDPFDTINYTVYLDNQYSNILTFDVGTDTSFRCYDVLENTTYYWKVIANDLSDAISENIGGLHNFFINTMNDPPVFVSLPDTNFNEDEILSVPFSFFFPYISDPDNTDSTLYISGCKTDDINIDASEKSLIIYESCLKTINLKSHNIQSVMSI